MTRAILAAVVAAAVAVGAAGAVTTPSALQQDVDALVAAGAPGVILLVRDGNKTTRLTAGVAEIATSTPMQAADQYRIASLTKTYVATVVLQLVAEGKLRLSDTVERWLPGLVPNGRKITIRQLLNHTSGLADHERDPDVLAPYLKGDLGYYWSPTRLVEIAASRPVRFPPGATKVASYSSTNYVIAGLIVERATGNKIEHRAGAPDLPAAPPHGHVVSDTRNAAAEPVRSRLLHPRAASADRSVARSARRCPARPARSSRRSTTSRCSTGRFSRDACSSPRSSRR